MKNRRLSISSKVNLLFFLGMSFIGLSIGLTFYFQYSDYLQKSAEETLKNAIYSAEILFPAEESLSYNKESSMTDEYKFKWKQIRSLSEKFKLAYIYVLVKNNEGKFYYTFDSGDDPEVIAVKQQDGKYIPKFADHASEERRKLPFARTDQTPDDYFDIYDEAPKASYEAYEKNDFVIAEEYTDKYGTFKSAFYPLRDKSGKVVGVFGADYDISYIKSLKKKSIILFSLLMFAGVLIAVLFSIIIRHSIVKRIEMLSYGSDEISKGNLQFKIQLKQYFQDEIGELADNFNSMCSKLDESFQKIKEYNEDLEKKVEARTLELQATLQNVQALKFQQDGDYFLTTLVANPLMQNRNRSELVKIEFLIKQKKEFQFKGKNHHLGGDICVSGNLNFKGERYCMFFNGDAMGKSMQGASGALVIGSLINSIMARSAANKKVLNLKPEEWLEETYREMQRVMEAFDGAMLVSCTLGLLSEKSGKMYYFNAEHPFTILYRDGIASFIEDKISVHKLGFPSTDSPEIYFFDLKPGDVIFCGSDGKDDLIISYDKESGQRVINEDETLILQLIEESKGDKQNLLEILKSKGELSDDFSLVKIIYKDEDSIIRIEKDQFDELNTLLPELIKEQKYEQVLEQLEQFPNRNLQFEYYKALAQSRLGKNREALQTLMETNAEIQENKKVLRLLSQIYYDLALYSESKQYLERLLVLEPENEKLKSMHEKLLRKVKPETEPSF
ncbi:MAG: SpoIIE family protein phosphatase [Leptospiraceae bacterium]|nr:SpoIIE family protein phosphatase [Leptospiraceae bacterium]